MPVRSRQQADSTVPSLAIWSAVIAAVAAMGLLLCALPSAKTAAGSERADANGAGSVPLTVPERFDHSVVSHLPDEAKPAPQTVASYER